MKARSTERGAFAAGDWGAFAGGAGVCAWSGTNANARLTIERLASLLKYDITLL
jgi:hypothetical protein